MVPRKAQARLKPSDQRLKDCLKHFSWGREELLWLQIHRPDLPKELQRLIYARLRELAPR